MDGKAGRGGGGAPARNAATGATTSGKKRAKATRSRAATQEAVARAGKSSNAPTAGAAGGGKKKTNAAVVSSAPAEKKTHAALQSGNQQQQQHSDQTGKKKKKKRRLHAGAVAAKAAAKAAEAAAAHAAASPRAPAAAGENKQTGVAKPHGGPQLAQNTRQNTRKAAQASVGASKTIASPRARSSSTAAAGAEITTATSLLKPMKKKQKLGTQQQQQQQQQQPIVAQKTLKKKQQQQQQAVQTSIPKPKITVKRNIDETAQQVSTPATQPVKQTIRPPAAIFVAPGIRQESLSEPVAKKPKMVVLNRRFTQASSELPVVTAAPVTPPPPPLSTRPPVAPKEAIAAPASPIQDNNATTSDSGTQAVDVADSVLSPAAERKPDTEVSLAISTITPEPETPSQTTAAAAAQDASYIEKSISLPLDAVENTQEANLPAHFSPTAQQPQSPLADVPASPDAPVVHEQAFAIHEEALATSEEETDADFFEQPQSIEVISLTSSDSETEDEEEEEDMEPFYAKSVPSSPERNDLLEEWLGNTISPLREFEADDAFLRPEPVLASLEDMENALNPTSSVEDVDTVLIPAPSHPIDDIPVLEIPVTPSEVVLPPADTRNSVEPPRVVIEEQNMKVEASFEVLELDTGRQSGYQESSPVFKLEKPFYPEPESSRVKSEEPKHEEPISTYAPPPPPRLPPASVPISTEPSYRALLRDLSAESSLRTPSSIELPQQPRWSEKKRSWGASFGMSASSSTPEANPSAGTSSSSQLVSSHVTSASMTSPLSSWFLSKGHANFVQHVSFPPRPANDRHRRSLSPRKQLSNSQVSQAAQHGLTTQHELVEEKRYAGTTDDDDGEGSSTDASANAFLESLALRSNWRTWYGNVDKRDLLDPPLQHVPAEVQQAVDSVSQLTEIEVADDSTGGESQERRTTTSSSIELLEAEIRAEKVRARAFDQELLLMLRGD